jgi:hypothetical protein
MAVDLDTPRFLLSDVAKAAGMEVCTVRAWVKRGLVPLSGSDKRGFKAGVAHRVTLRTALVIVGAAEIAAILKTGVACRIAQDWANDL